MIYINAPDIEADVFTCQPGPLEGEMPPDQAYELMRDTLKALLPSLERIARTAKNPAARKKLMVQIQQIKDALTAAEEASRRPKSWRQIVNSDPEPAASSGSAAS